MTTRFSALRSTLENETGQDRRLTKPGNERTTINSHRYATLGIPRIYKLSHLQHPVSLSTPLQRRRSLPTTRKASISWHNHDALKFIVDSRLSDRSKYDSPLVRDAANRITCCFRSTFTVLTAASVRSNTSRAYCVMPDSSHLRP